MQVLTAFLVACLLVGGSARYRVVDRPLILLGICTVVAASFYTLRVVL